MLYISTIVFDTRNIIGTPPREDGSSDSRHAVGSNLDILPTMHTNAAVGVDSGNPDTDANHDVSTTHLAYRATLSMALS